MGYPKKLKKLFKYEGDNVSMIGNLENSFFIRTSDIMKDFMEVCEKNNEEKIRDYLLKKYPNNLVNLFLVKVENISDNIFVNEQKSHSPYKLDRSIKILTLNICHSCNMRCSYCFEELEFRKTSGMMDKETAIKSVELFLEQLSDGSGEIIFTGGEPILNFKVIREVVKYTKGAANKKISFTVKTNATLITDEILDFLMENSFKLNISIDGNKAVHDKNRMLANGEGSFEKVSGLINKAIEKGYGQKVFLNGVVAHNTIKNVKSSSDFIKSYKNINKAYLKPIMTTDNKELDLDENDLSAYSKYLFKLAVDLYMKNTNINAGLLDQNVSNNICGIGLWHISVDINGDIYPCYRLSGIDEFKMGNICTTQFDLDIPKRLKDLYEIDSNSECSECYSKLFCKNGCYADKLLNSPESKCNNYEKKFGDFFLVENFINSCASSVLPII